MQPTTHQTELPHLSGQTFLTDGGMETTFVFQDGIELPGFAAFTLVDHPDGKEHLLNYFRRYADIARAHGTGFILESPTWRASSDWGEQLGYSNEQLRVINQTSVELLKQIRNEYQTEQCSIVICGNVGPRGDGYAVGEAMTSADAERYHSYQLQVLADSGVDMLSALTLNYTEEAIGITRAANKLGVPVVISFTVETDGTLPSGQPLADAITQVDAETECGPAYYMINCAHPTHFKSVLDSDTAWTGRIRGVRANASKLSHAELDQSEELDQGDVKDLSCEYMELRRLLPNLNILGGCCGTDHTHVEAIADAWFAKK